MPRKRAPQRKASPSPRSARKALPSASPFQSGRKRGRDESSPQVDHGKERKAAQEPQVTFLYEKPANRDEDGLRDVVIQFPSSISGTSSPTPKKKKTEAAPGVRKFVFGFRHTHGETDGGVSYEHDIYIEARDSAPIRSDDDDDDDDGAEEQVLDYHQLPLPDEGTAVDGIIGACVDFDRRCLSIAYFTKKEIEVEVEDEDEEEDKEGDEEQEEIAEAEEKKEIVEDVVAPARDEEEWGAEPGEEWNAEPAEPKIASPKQKGESQPTKKPKEKTTRKEIVKELVMETVEWSPTSPLASMTENTIPTDRVKLGISLFSKGGKAESLSISNRGSGADLKHLLEAFA